MLDDIKRLGEVLLLRVMEYNIVKSVPDFVVNSCMLTVAYIKKRKKKRKKKK
jgi:hypothetical protein